MNRRSFLRAASAASLGAVAGPLIRVKGAFGETGLKAKRSVIVSIAGGLRAREALGMAEGATMPNLFGHVPLITGHGDADAGPVKIAPEYDLPRLVLPQERATPLYTEGALVTNLRYDAGVPGHLQGAACLATGAYNDIDNRADAHPPAPTLFELHRRETNAPALDAWYLSNVAGFYRALQFSAHPEFGARFGGSWLAPPSTLTPVVPLIATGKREIVVTADSALPAIDNDEARITAVRKLSAVIDGNTAALAADTAFHATPDENAAVEKFLSDIYGDKTYAVYDAPGLGVGLSVGGGFAITNDGATIYQAERILEKFKPSVMVVSLIDVDACHDDFNGYLYSQQIADALVAHLWAFIESTPGLAGETALFVLPEHGRQLDFNGKNVDSLGRSGLDHGGGDDGDRDVWLLALGPDFAPGVSAPTGVTQAGRTSGRYETIDVVMTAAQVIGRADLMQRTLTDLGQRPGLPMEGILR